MMGSPAASSRSMWIVAIVALLSPLLAVALPAEGAPLAPGSDATRNQEPERVLFSVLGTRDGMSNSSVSSIVQDRMGFIWFGTQGGLDRYDGYSFKVFENRPFDASSLGNNQVQTLFLDGDALWVGTYGGLDRLDLATERFTVYRNDPQRADSLSNNTVICIARDERGSLWVGTLDGLNRLDERTGTFARFEARAGDPGGLQSSVIRALKLDHAGRLWVGTSGGGLSLYDYDRKDFRTFRKDPRDRGSLLSNYVMSIDEDSEGFLWLGTWYGGISRFDPATGRCENYPTADERVYVVSAAESGVVLAGTWGGGLFEFDRSTRQFSRYRAGGEPGSLSHDVIYSILRDSSGELWFGTNGGGVDKLSRAMRSYSAIAAADSGDSIPRGKIYVVQVDPRGDLWVGVYNAGLARRSAKTGRWTRYRHDPADPRSLPNDIVNFAFIDSDGRIWFGTNDGLARFDRARGDFSVIKPDGRPDGLSSEILYAMQEDEGGYWLGTFRSGLDYLDRRTGAFRHYAHDASDPSSLSDNLVFDLERDAKGRLWVGTNHGLDRLEGSAFVHYFYDPANASGISNDSIQTIYSDSKGVLWIGTTGGGLMRYEPETDSFVTYTKKDGLPSNSVIRIVEDRDANLWIATQLGLVLYDRASGIFRSLTVYNDLRNREFFRGAFAAPDGSIYFGALDTLYRFDAGRYEYNAHRPPVVLTDIEVNHLAARLPVAACRLKRLDLGYRENSVSFEFAALDFREPDRNQYAYRLDGFDRDWIQAGAQHSASYTNLPGGNYTFRVRASNNDGLWNEEGLRLPVHVGTAPWASPWAVALYALLLIAGTYAVASRGGRLRWRAAAAELDEARRRLTEAEDRLELLSVIDPLTRIPNRRRLDDSLEVAFSRASREKEPIAVLMADIDFFKAYNDRNGRQAGDECLRRVAGCLTACLERATDLVCRYGGEEFLVVLPNTDIEGAAKVAEKARLSVEALAIPHGGSRVSAVVTVSVGCAALRPGLGQTAAILIAAADRALYEAKERGRNRVEC